jgi:hypothetical protein
MIREIDHNLVAQGDEGPFFGPFHLKGRRPGDGGDVETAPAAFPLPPLPLPLPLRPASL